MAHILKYSTNKQALSKKEFLLRIFIEAVEFTFDGYKSLKSNFYCITINVKITTKQLHHGDKERFQVFLPPHFNFAILIVQK